MIRIRLALALVLAFLAWDGYRWPLFAFIVLQSITNELFVLLLNRKADR